MANVLRGFVLGVVSGDTLVVSAPFQGSGVPAQVVVKFSGVNAPQLGWKDRLDEPFAWASRDALRAKVVGEPVQVRIVNTANNKSYGEVLFGEESLALWVVSNGWATVREVRNADETFAALKAAEAQAQASKLGLWTDDAKAKKAAIRPAKGPLNASEFFGAHGGKPLDALVDGVRTGSTLRLILLPSMQPIVLFLAGIRSPGYTRTEGEGGASVEVAQPFAEEAKYFVELRLLHRQVQVVLEFPDDKGNFFGTVLHPRGNVAESLLRDGLAKVVDWSAAHVTYAPALRAAETQAKTGRVRLWRDYVPVAPSIAADSARFTGTVVEVPSADCLVVQDERTRAERRVFLASVRAPRMRTGPEGRAEAWAWEAKEFLRKRVIGKRVDVTLEYRRGDGPAGAGPAAAAAAGAASAAAAAPAGGASAAQQERFFATVIVNTKNVAVSLIAQGLATVVRHRDDDERSSHFDELMAAQANAEKSKSGLHAAKAAVPYKRVESDAAKASMIVDRLRAHGRVPAVVEFCSSGARLKVYLESEGMVAPFALAGIRCPRSDQGAPFAAEAQAFTRLAALHRDVGLEVEAVDKKGTLLGQVYLPDKTNLGLLLLSAGLGWMEGYNLEASPYHAAMSEAQAAAKAAKLNYWSTYVEPVAAPAEDDDEGDAAAAGPASAGGAAAGKKRAGAASIYDVVITEVLSATTVYAQVVGETTAKLEALMAKFAAHHLRPEAAVPPPKLKAGTYVSGQFGDDQCWYRAKITEVTTSPAGEPAYALLYIDYGNSEVVPAARLRELPPDFMELVPQARKCSLAFVLPAPDSEVAAEGKAFLESQFLGQQLLATVEFTEKESETWFVSLFDGPDRTSVAVELLAAGLARVDKKNKNARRFPELCDALRDAESAAIKSRAGLWQYGEVDYDEDARK